MNVFASREARRRPLGLMLSCSLTLLAASARAQPQSGAAGSSADPAAPVPAAPAASEAAPAAAPEAAPAPEPVVAPRLIGEAIVEYPPGASGAADVVLELVIGVTGEVLDARPVQGEEPFASAALSRARQWRFEPAHSAGKPRAARIRFLISFSPPPEAVPSAAPSTPAPITTTPGAAKPPPELETPIEVTVRGAREEPTATTLTRAEVRQLPGAFGDPFRAIEALPGVTPIVSGVPFFYVRGAPPGNVGYFLDGIRLPLLYHVGLGPSVVHPAMVSKVDLYPGAYPTRYGRFSGGIVAGEVEPPRDRFHGEWQIRLFDTGAMAEAPFAGGRGHVLLGGRYSYTAYLISLLSDEAVRLEYWDYQLRTTYRITPSDELGVFAFGSFDYFGEDTDEPDDDLFSSEFHRIDLRYDHAFSEHMRWRTAFTWGFDRTRVAENAGYALDHRLQLRSEFHARLAPWLRLSAGADVLTDAYSVVSNNFNEDPEFEPPRAEPAPAAPTPAAPPGAPAPPPGVVPPPEEPPPEFDNGTEFDDDEEFERLFPSRRDWAGGAYVDLDMDLARYVHLVPGLRFDVYASKNSVAYSLEPRISAEFRVTENLTLKNGLGLAAQPPSFVVPVAGFEIGGLPGGLQRSMQSSAGLEYRLPDAMKLSVSLFHNAFFNMTDILSLARLDDAEEELRLDTRARGQAYGMELMFHRDLTRRLGGFLAYTLSRSQRFTSIGPIAATFDRTHVLNAVLAYDLGRRWRAGGRLVFYTGNPEFTVSREGERRLPPFHRLDVRIEKRWPIGTSGAFWALVLEVLNTTLSTEVVSRNCEDEAGAPVVGFEEPAPAPARQRCEEQAIGPVTIPSIAFEGRF